MVGNPSFTRLGKVIQQEFRSLVQASCCPHSYNLPLTALLVEVLAEGVEALTKEGGELVYPAHDISERFRM